MGFLCLVEELFQEERTERKKDIHGRTDGQARKQERQANGNINIFGSLPKSRTFISYRDQVISIFYLT